MTGETIICDWTDKVIAKSFQTDDNYTKPAGVILASIEEKVD